MEVWGGVNWANKRGCTRLVYVDNDALKNNSRIFILPLSFGFKFIFPILPRMDVYIGAGVCYSFLKIKSFYNERYSYSGYSYSSSSHSSFKKEIYKNDFGALFKLGFQFALSDSTFLDFFTDYYAQRFCISHHTHDDSIGHNLDCSGFKFGIGLGVYF